MQVFNYLEMLCPNTEEIQFEHFISLIFYIYNQQIKQLNHTKDSIDEEEKIDEISELSEKDAHNMLIQHLDVMNSTQNILKVLMNKIKGVNYDDVCFPDFNYDTLNLVLEADQINFVANFHEGLEDIFDKYSKDINERYIKIINLFDVINIIWKYNIANNLKSNNEVAEILQHFIKPKGVNLKVLEDIFDNPELKSNRNSIEQMLRQADVNLDKINLTFSSFVLFICCCAIHYKERLETKEDVIHNYDDYLRNVLEIGVNRNPHEEIDLDVNKGNSFKEEEPKESKFLAEAKRMKDAPDGDDTTFLQDCLSIFDKEFPEVTGSIRETQNILPNHSNTLFTNKLENEKFKFPINLLNVEVQVANKIKAKAKEDKEIEKAKKPVKKDKKGPVLPIFWEEMPSNEKDKIKTFGHPAIEDMKQRFLKQSYKEVLLNNYVYPSLIREVLVIPRNISKEVISIFNF